MSGICWSHLNNVCFNLACLKKITESLSKQCLHNKVGTVKQRQWYFKNSVCTKSYLDYWDQRFISKTNMFWYLDLVKAPTARWTAESCPWGSEAEHYFLKTFSVLSANNQLIFLDFGLLFCSRTLDSHPCGGSLPWGTELRISGCRMVFPVTLPANKLTNLHIHHPRAISQVLKNI